MNSNTKLNFTEKEYSRTDSGKSWRAQPDEVTEKIVDRNFHSNMTSEDTCKFFRRLGGSESVERSYTSQGYIVTQLISMDPGRTVRKVRTFSIVE